MEKRNAASSRSPKPRGCLLPLLFVLLAHPVSAAELNWVVNGDFQSTGGWNGALTLQSGRNGEPSAFFENLSPVWTERSQRIDLPQPPPPAIEVSGWLKIEKVVPGSKDWEMARITVVFYDKAGNRLGNWPAPIAQVQGTKDWDYYSSQYSLPPETSWVTLEMSLGHCTGRAWFTGLKVLAYDYDGKPLARGFPS